MSWPSVAALVAVLAFVFFVFRILLKEKAIAQENTIRFALIVVGVVLAAVIVFVPVANPNVVSGLVGILGAIFGYVIRDIAHGKNQT